MLFMKMPTPCFSAGLSGTMFSFGSGRFYIKLFSSFNGPTLSLPLLFFSIMRLDGFFSSISEFFFSRLLREAKRLLSGGS